MVGVTTEDDGAAVMQKINGLILDGRPLQVKLVTKKQGHTTTGEILAGTQEFVVQKPMNPQINCEPYLVKYINMQQNRTLPIAPISFSGIHGTNQTLPIFNYPQQIPHQTTQIMSVKFDQEALGFNNSDINSSIWTDWNTSEDQCSDHSKSSLNWDSSGDKKDRKDIDQERDRSPHRFGGNSPIHVSPIDMTELSPHMLVSTARKYGRNTPPHEPIHEYVPEVSIEMSAPRKRKLSPECSNSDANKRLKTSNLEVNNQQRLVSQVRLPQPTHNCIKPKTDHVRPLKRARCSDGPIVTPLVANLQPPKRQKPQWSTSERLAFRAETLRNQIASAISKEIINNLMHKNHIKPKQLVNELKQVIRLRLEKLFGDEQKLNFEEQMRVYRELYDKDSDAALYKEASQTIMSRTGIGKGQKKILAKINKSKRLNPLSKDIRTAAALCKVSKLQNNAQTGSNFNIQVNDSFLEQSNFSDGLMALTCSDALQPISIEPSPVKEMAKESSECATTENTQTLRRQASPTTSLENSQKIHQNSPSALSVAITCANTGYLPKGIANEVLAALALKIFADSWAADIKEPGPTFEKRPVYSHGIIKLWCTNEQTLAWLRHTVLNLAIPSGTQLVVRTRSDLPKGIFCGFMVPNQFRILKAPGDIERLISHQNPSFEVERWHLLKAEQQPERWLIEVSIPKDNPDSDGA